MITISLLDALYNCYFIFVHSAVQCADARSVNLQIDCDLYARLPVRLFGWRFSQEAGEEAGGTLLSIYLFEPPKFDTYPAGDEFLAKQPHAPAFP